MSFGSRLGAGGLYAALGLTCLSVLCTASPAGATTLRRMDLPELVATADRVVQARAVGNRVYWDSTHTQIFTDTDFEVLSDVKGAGPKRLTISQLGGRIAPVEMLVEGTPSFTKGEEVVLFTELHPNGQRLIVGLEQGVMRIHTNPDTGERIAVSSVPGEVRFVGGSPQRGAASVDSLLEQIRQIAAGAGRGPGLSRKPEKPTTVDGDKP